MFNAASVKMIGQAGIRCSSDMSEFAKPDAPAIIEQGHTRKTKIICTLGPACWSVDNLASLIEAGMNCARLNFSHGDHEAHGGCVDRFEEACKRFPDKQVALLLDTKGPEIRSGFFKPECNGKVELTAGETLRLVTDYEFKGDSSTIAMTYDKLPTAVVPGQQILMADGSVVLEVKECGKDYVDCKILNDACIGERKNMNLPGVHVDLPVLQEKDKNDILEFGIPRGVHFIAASFVQSGKDVEEIREVLGRRGRHIKIISKIENEAGLKNFDEILEKSDGIMVARGDLGMEIPTENVFMAQKTMIGKCNMAGKFVVTATQMLESMIGAPRPTRAEASDVANAVLDGSDVVMLSGETANGKFPQIAVATMRKICEKAESSIMYRELYQRIRNTDNTAETNVPQCVCSSAVGASIDCNAKLIIVLTETGSTARMIAKYRPQVPILALCAAPPVVKQLMLIRGVTSLEVASFQGTDIVLKSAMEAAKSMGLCVAGDQIVAIHGMKEEISGHSNLMKIISCI